MVFDQATEIVVDWFYYPTNPIEWLLVFGCIIQPIVRCLFRSFIEVLILGSGGLQPGSEFFFTTLRILFHHLYSSLVCREFSLPARGYFNLRRCTWDRRVNHPSCAFKLFPSSMPPSPRALRLLGLGLFSLRLLPLVLSR